MSWWTLIFFSNNCFELFNSTMNILLWTQFWFELWNEIELERMTKTKKKLFFSFENKWTQNAIRVKWNWWLRSALTVQDHYDWIKKKFRLKRWCDYSVEIRLNGVMTQLSKLIACTLLYDFHESGLQAIVNRYTYDCYFFFCALFFCIIRCQQIENLCRFKTEVRRKCNKW